MNLRGSLSRHPWKLLFAGIILMLVATQVIGMREETCYNNKDGSFLYERDIIFPSFLDNHYISISLEHQRIPNDLSGFLNKHGIVSSSEDDWVAGFDATYTLLFKERIMEENTSRFDGLPVPFRLLNNSHLLEYLEMRAAQDTTYPKKLAACLAKPNTPENIDFKSDLNDHYFEWLDEMGKKPIEAISTPSHLSPQANP